MQNLFIAAALAFLGISFYKIMAPEAQVEPGQRRKSTAAKLAGKFRRASTTSQDTEQLDTSIEDRKSSANFIDQRKSSVASSSTPGQLKSGLPLRVTKSRSKKSREKDNSSQPSVPNKIVALFFALPNELQINILCHLTFGEILSLRLTNSSFHHLIHQNESPIVRHCIKHEANSLSLDLWPPEEPPKPATISYFLGLTHRDFVAWGLADHVADFIMTKICRRRTIGQQAIFYPHYLRIKSRSQPLIMTLYHFLESYRNILLGPLMNEARVSPNSTPLYGQSKDSLGGAQTTGDLLSAEKRIIDSYDPEQLLQVHQMYKLLVPIFVRKLRPPSYAGRFERSLRGWSKTPASQDDIVKVLLLGGIKEVMRIIEIKTYAARRKALDQFIEGLKLPKEDRADGNGINVVTEPPIAFSPNSGHVANSVERFVTAFLNEEMVDRISPALPELRHMWSHTAEATLLDKGVIRSVHEIPTTREFIESLMRIEDGGGNDELHDGVDEDARDGEEERIEIEGLTLSGNQGINGLI